MEESDLKRTIGIIIMLSIMLTGCTSGKNSVDNAATSNAQSQPQSASQNVVSINDNIDTSKSPFEKGYYDYQGTIGDNMSIHMSIYPLKKEMVGSYLYDSQRKEIKLKGKAGEKDIVLYEYDEAGKNTGVFKGTMSTVDKIQGTWSTADGKRSYPFTLSLKSILPGAEYGKRYAVAVGAKNDQEVEAFADKVQSYVKNDNREQLAEVVSYPITVKIEGKPVNIQNKDEFVQLYDQIFYAKYKQAISNAVTKYLFANSKGIMFGENMYNTWINEIDSKLMITAINN
jgi:hypothetical protein